MMIEKIYTVSFLTKDKDGKLLQIEGGYLNQRDSCEIYIGKDQGIWFGIHNEPLSLTNTKKLLDETEHSLDYEGVFLKIKANNVNLEIRDVRADCPQKESDGQLLATLGIDSYEEFAIDETDKSFFDLYHPDSLLIFFKQNKTYAISITPWKNYNKLSAPLRINKYAEQ